MRERSGRRRLLKTWVTGLILTACAHAEPAAAPPKVADELKMAPFGSVTLVRPSGKTAENPKHIVLWIADGATTEDLPAFAEASGSIVARVDLGEYVRHLTGSKSKCAYPAAHFEALSQGLRRSSGWRATSIGAARHGAGGRSPMRCSPVAAGDVPRCDQRGLFGAARPAVALAPEPSRLHGRGRAGRAR